ncbi:unnamed protein product [Alopecurus aequalis]
MSSTALYIAVLSASVTLMLVANFLVIFWALCRGAGGDADQERMVDCGGKGLSADERETLPCHSFFSSDGAADCAVCLEAFEAGDRCRRPPMCEHSFHAKCVDPWLEKSRCCPVCRADVVPSGEIVKVTGEGALAAERRNRAS